MCWVSEKPPIKRICKKPITVYKKSLIVNDERFVSLFYDFEYIKNEIYTEEIGEPIKMPLSYIINKGFHAYKYGHSDLVNRTATKIGIFEIPIGAIYYLSENGEYVSNQMKYIEPERYNHVKNKELEVFTEKMNNGYSINIKNRDNVG